MSAVSTTISIDPDNLGFDPQTLRDKYRVERDKRIRTDGSAQYIETDGDFSSYVDDPYIDATLTRAPIFDEVEAIVIGGGFGGMLAAARLSEVGIRDIRLIEKGGDVGGTWYWNRYPGAMCDVESYIYMPLLEEVGYMPSEKYAHAPEILRHSRAIAERYNLYEKGCFQTQVTHVAWDDSQSLWVVHTNRGDIMRARFVAMSNGPLNRPKLPGIPGIDEFAGHTFHTSRWDYDYTGGDSNGGLAGLQGKRVGIIGTGATAIQCVPHLGEWAEQLYVFQRTPSSVDVRNNRPTDTEWAGGLEPGWQQRRMDNFNVLVSGGFEDVDLVGDGWTDIFRNLTGMLPPEGAEKMSRSEVAAITELADFRKMESVRDRVNALVADGQTAAALKPWYRQFCKRPCFHDEYLQTFNRPNVHLVDTLGKGVERMSPDAVVVDGVEYPVDCLIFATGFEVGTGYTRASGFDVVGRDNVRLSDKWADGFRTFHGLHSHGFPNCYFMGLTQTALSPNFPHMLNEQAKHLAYVAGEANRRGAQTAQATPIAEDEWVKTIHRLARRGARFFEECTPGYYNNEGNPGTGKGFIDGAYGGGPVEFFTLLEDWRKSGKLEGIEFD
jgi:cation diffusion facilitator CzcD-associated flavoprotein CzcO